MTRTAIMYVGLGISCLIVLLFVRNRQKATVTVVAPDMTKEQANEIIYLVKNEVDELVNVSVNVQKAYVE